MALPEITTYDEWERARRELLVLEKQETRARDALSTARRELPMVRIEKDYRFNGELSLLDLFEGRDQLLLTHFMFDPSWEDGCPSCTANADEVSPGLLDHLHTRGTTLAFCSRAPLEKIERYKAKRGWDFPWYSSFGSDFNVDMHVTMDPAVSPPQYNFRPLPWEVPMGETQEQPGTSAFLRVGDEVFLTYQVFARGTEWTGGSYAYLDLTALGRQEEWEKPAGRSDSLRAAEPNFLT
jgi:predicted dithiol-disulfide oxidoreductase (DUF899 family)